MKGYCRVRPIKGHGQQLFDAAKKKYGVKKAWRLIGLVDMPKFSKDSLRLDSEGYPLLLDIENTPLGQQALFPEKRQVFPTMDNTEDNYTYLVGEAHRYNTENKDKVAIVEQKDSKLQIKIVRATLNNREEARRLYGVIRLNSSVAATLAPIGVTREHLLEVEVRAGRVGVTDFSAASNIANDTVTMIRTADNKEGTEAISEEFAHLLVGAFKDSNNLVKRALDALINNDVLVLEILGEEYSDVAYFYGNNQALMAEEALGKLLQLYLIEGSSENASLLNLMQRLTQNLKNKFKGLNDSAILEAIDEVNEITSTLAQNVLNGSLKFDKQIIRLAQRAELFNSLSSMIATNIEILTELRDTEIKRYLISNYISETDRLKQRKKIATLDNAILDENIDTRIVILKYAKLAIEDLQQLLKLLKGSNRISFQQLRYIRNYVHSYGPFIVLVRRALYEAETDTENSSFLSDIELSDGTKVSLRDVIKDVRDAIDALASPYQKIVQKRLIEFLRPYFGDDKVVTMGSDKGKVITLEDVIMKSTGDISFLAAWGESMADNSNMFLQLFDAVTREAKFQAREDTREFITRVYNLMEYCKEHGINNFEFIFEHDENGNKTGNYISKLNQSKFLKELEKKQKYLDAKYGESEFTAEEKELEYRRWLFDNADPDDINKPKDIEKYKNPEYESLTTELQYILDEYLKLKEEADEIFPIGRTELHRAILMRKSSGNRIVETLSNPMRTLENVVESVKNTFKADADIDLEYGGTALRNFDGTEYLTLPTLYVSRLSNPNEITNDIFSALLCYAHGAHTYKLLKKVVDPLETMRNWVLDKNHEIIEAVDDKEVVEKINAFGKTITKKITKSDSNIVFRMNLFMADLVYGRHKVDEGTVLGVKTSKLGDWVIRSSGMAMLGFNYLSNFANVATGIAMGNIEAFTGEHFNKSDLFRADRLYASWLPEYLANLGNTTNTSQLELFDNLLDVKIDFKGKLHGNKINNLLQKIFGESIAYLGLEGGDHWLYNRIAMAVCSATKVYIPKNLKKVPKVKDFMEAVRTMRKIEDNSAFILLNEDGTFYVRSGENYARVTSVIQADGENEAYSTTHEDGSPNNWILPSTNIGTGIDELVRDFFDNKLIKGSDGTWQNAAGLSLELMYPNATKEQLNSFVSLLVTLKEEFDRRGLTVSSRNIVARGQILIKVGGKTRLLNVAGTIDILAHDKDGNFYIFDMKTHRGAISLSKKKKWASLLSLYKLLLEQEYGITVKELGIIPIKVTYPTPKGEYTGGEEGTGEYTENYDLLPNQINLNGTPYKGANPNLEEMIKINPRELDIDVERLDSNILAKTIKLADTSNMELMSLLDTIETITVGDRGIKRMVFPEEMYDENGELVEISKVSAKIKDIVRHMYGIYDEEGAAAANRYILGRMLLQNRRWIVPQFLARFGKARHSNALDRDIEGWWRTGGKFIIAKACKVIGKDLLRGKVQIAASWSELTDAEKKNIMRCIWDFLGLASVFLLVRFAPWPDDKDRPMAVKVAEYMARRELHELGMLVPSPIMLQEVLKTVLSPLPCLSSIDKLIRLLSSAIDYESYMDVRLSGKYKGLNEVEVNLMKAPVFGLNLKLLLQRFEYIEESIQYLARPR